jgi:hypothetical protein
MQDVGDYFGLHYWSRVGDIVRDAHGRSGEASVKTPVPLNGGFVLGRQRFQQQIVTMVGRRTWPDTSGRPSKEPVDANQVDLPTRDRGIARPHFHWFFRVG